MEHLVTMAIVGFVAQMVDGVLGMGFGVVAASFLVSGGVAPAIASATIHSAELATTWVSGVAHWRLGNIDWRLVSALALPGSAAAFVGTVFLVNFPGEAARPVVAGLLFLLGLVILVSSLRRASSGAVAAERHLPRRRLLLPLGLLAGFVDATGGGGWGPLTVSLLLACSPAESRSVIGSVNTSEALVALAGVAGFLLLGGSQILVLPWIIAFGAGGVVAAPAAAWLVRVIPAHLLSVLVAGLLLIVNIRTLAHALHISSSVPAEYLIVAVLWLPALGIALARRQASHLPPTALAAATWRSVDPSDGTPGSPRFRDPAPHAGSLGSGPARRVPGGR